MGLPLDQFERMSFRAVEHRDESTETGSAPLPRINNLANLALEGAGITSLQDLARCTKREIKNLHGMGPKGMRILAEAMASGGVNYAAEVSK